MGAMTWKGYGRAMSPSSLARKRSLRVEETTPHASSQAPIPTLTASDLGTASFPVP